MAKRVALEVLIHELLEEALVYSVSFNGDECTVLAEREGYRHYRGKTAYEQAARAHAALVKR